MGGGGGGGWTPPCVLGEGGGVGRLNLSGLLLLLGEGLCGGRKIIYKLSWDMTNVMSKKAEDSYQPYLEPLYVFPLIMSSLSSGSYILLCF